VMKTRGFDQPLYVLAFDTQPSTPKI